ncbi:MAG: hypothetical protein ACLFN2_08150 [Bacteroidales bacterium]
MKTRMIITAAMLLSFSFVFAQENQEFLTFKGPNGEILIQPVKTEVVPDAVPFTVEAYRLRKRFEAANEPLDLSLYFKPEIEEPLPFELRKPERIAFKFSGITLAVR